MKQGLLAFQYEQEKGSMGMTGLSGLMTYVELMQAAGLKVIGRAPRETAGERSGLDGQPDDHLADATELGRRRVGVRP